ncbi:MAG: SPOR domain-containing protein [Pseudomonadota bacterium]
MTDTNRLAHPLPRVPSGLRIVSEMPLVSPVAARAAAARRARRQALAGATAMAAALTLGACMARHEAPTPVAAGSLASPPVVEGEGGAQAMLVALDTLPDGLTDEVLQGAYSGPFSDRFELRPDLFFARGPARWLGGETRAGIWIAHPSATAYARVRLINRATGRAADAALIPSLRADVAQLSAEAAEALGVSGNRDTDIVTVAIDYPGSALIVAVRDTELRPEHALEVAQRAAPAPTLVARAAPRPAQPTAPTPAVPAPAVAVAAAPTEDAEGAAVDTDVALASATAPQVSPSVGAGVDPVETSRAQEHASATAPIAVAAVQAETPAAAPVAGRAEPGADSGAATGAETATEARAETGALGAVAAVSPTVSPTAAPQGAAPALPRAATLDTPPTAPMAPRQAASGAPSAPHLPSTGVPAGALASVDLAPADVDASADALGIDIGVSLAAAAEPARAATVRLPRTLSERTAQALAAARGSDDDGTVDGLPAVADSAEIMATARTEPTGASMAGIGGPRRIAVEQRSTPAEAGSFALLSLSVRPATEAEAEAQRIRTASVGEAIAAPETAAVEAPASAQPTVPEAPSVTESPAAMPAATPAPSAAPAAGDAGHGLAEADTEAAPQADEPDLAALQIDPRPSSAMISETVAVRTRQSAPPAAAPAALTAIAPTPETAAPAAAEEEAAVVALAAPAVAIPQAALPSAALPANALAPLPVPTVEDATSALDRPFVQVGVFTALDNARELVAALQADGVDAVAFSRSFRGKPALRVRAGPFHTEQERQRFIASLSRHGIGDAMPVDR